MVTHSIFPVYKKYDKHMPRSPTLFLDTTVVFNCVFFKAVDKLYSFSSVVQSALILPWIIL